MKNLSNIINELDIVTKEYVDKLAESKVEKIDGKGLSTNDFTDEYKEKLTNMSPTGDYTLPVASPDALGGVKIGNDLTIDENGVLNINKYNIPEIGKSQVIETLYGEYTLTTVINDLQYAMWKSTPVSQNSNFIGGISSSKSIKSYTLSNSAFYLTVDNIQKLIYFSAEEGIFDEYSATIDEDIRVSFLQMLSKFFPEIDFSVKVFMTGTRYKISLLCTGHQLTVNTYTGDTYVDMLSLISWVDGMTNLLDVNNISLAQWLSISETDNAINFIINGIEGTVSPATSLQDFFNIINNLDAHVIIKYDIDADCFVMQSTSSTISQITATDDRMLFTSLAFYTTDDNLYISKSGSIVVNLTKPDGTLIENISLTEDNFNVDGNFALLQILQQQEKQNGVQSYNDLTDKPTLNGVEIKGNITSEELGIENGITPHIGENGNWFIGEEDTGVQANIDLTPYATTEELNQAINTINIPTKISELTNDSEFITNTVDNLTNYYKKSETYTQTEVNQLINAITTLNIEVVSSLPTSNISTTTIYLKGSKKEGTNSYDEYIYVNETWELIGTTAIDLAPYATKTYVDTKVDGITKTSLGLENVENKSSATIRNEITSANVTSALGYTPLKEVKGVESVNYSILATSTGWYRIANIPYSAGSFIFQIHKGWNNTPYSSVQFAVSLNCSTAPKVAITQLQGIINNGWFSKVRVLYDDAANSSNFHIEVYIGKVSSSETVFVKTLHSVSSVSNILVSTSTAGSIPSGYTSKEFEFTTDTLKAENIVGNINASNITAGTLNADRIPKNYSYLEPFIKTPTTANEDQFYKLFTITPKASGYKDFHYAFEVVGRSKTLTKFYITVATENNNYLKTPVVNYEGSSTIANNLKVYYFEDTTNATSRIEVWLKITSWNALSFYPKTAYNIGSAVTLTWNMTKETAFPTNATTEVTIEKRAWAGHATSATRADEATKVYIARSASTGYYPVLLTNVGDGTTARQDTVYAPKNNTIGVDPAAGAVKATVFDVNSKVEMKYNSTTECLDFIFK